jgi:hypothetical protein
VSTPEHTSRAVWHEAGHTAAAKCLGFFVDGISLVGRRPYLAVCIDDASKTAHEKYVVLAGGITGEKFRWPDDDYDREACQFDEGMIAERGGGPICNYLQAALEALNANRDRVQLLVKKLGKEFAEATLLAAVGSDLDGDSSPLILLSGAEIERLWTHIRPSDL